MGTGRTRRFVGYFLSGIFSIFRRRKSMKVKPSRREFLAASAAVGAGWISRAAQVETARFPQDIQVGIIGMESHYSEITKAAELFSEVRVTADADRNESLRTRASENETLRNAGG